MATAFQQTAFQDDAFQIDGVAGATAVKGPTRINSLVGDDNALDDLVSQNGKNAVGGIADGFSFERFWDGQAIDDLDVPIDALMWDLDGNFLGIIKSNDSEELIGAPQTVFIGGGQNSLVEV
jgi:hypothetical protein